MQQILSTLDSLSQTSNLRQIPADTQDSGLVDLTSNDYLGLVSDVKLRQEFLETLSPHEFIPSASASRLLGAIQKPYLELEQFLEEAYGLPSLLFQSGYHANVGIISSLGTTSTLFLADKLVHASIIDGLKLSGTTFMRFRHNDMKHLDMLLNKHAANYRRVVIIAESIYSMDGDSAPLEQLVALKEHYNNINGNNVQLYLDEAHAVGVMGPAGLGLAHTLTHRASVDIVIGTMGKALASAGAYAVFNSSALKLHTINRARSLIFSTALPPVQIRWSLHALKAAMQADTMRSNLKKLSALLPQLLNPNNPQPASHIQPYIIGSADKTHQASRKLLEAGFKVLPIRTPTVPPGTERLRFSLTASLTPDQLMPLKRAIATIRAGSIINVKRRAASL